MASSSRTRWIRRIIYILIIIIVIGVIVWNFTNTKKVSPYTTAMAERGPISQTVALSGTVEPTQRYQLQFSRNGKIEKIKVALGDKVKAGDVVASLEKNDLEFQLAGQKASLKVTQANLNKAYAGPREEELYLNQLKIQSAQVSANNLMVSQQNILTLGQRNVDNAAYELQKSQIALTQAQNSYNNLVQNNSASNSNQNFFYSVSQNINTNNQNPFFQDTLGSIDQYFHQTAAQNQMQLSQQISEAQRAMDIAQVNFQQAQNNYYRSQNDLQRQLDEIHGNASQAGINVASSIQQYNLLNEPPRESDVAALKAQVEQARQSVNLAQYQLDQSELKVPTDGIITSVNFKKGELVSPAQALITMDSSSYDIKTLVSEADISKLKIGQTAIITFDALDPNREFHGSILQISPAETVVQGVVYYEVKVKYESENAPVKPGMTANLTVKTAEKNNTLFVPTRAVLYEGNNTYVQVLHLINNKEDIEKRKVVVGLQGDENIEIVEGINENDQIVTFTKAT